MWVRGRTWWYCCWYRHRCRNLLRSHFLRSDWGPLRSGGAPIIPFCSYPHNYLHSCGAHQNCCGGGHCACCHLHGSLRGVWWSESALRWMSRTGWGSWVRSRSCCWCWRRRRGVWRRGGGWRTVALLHLHRCSGQHPVDGMEWNLHQGTYRKKN